MEPHSGVGGFTPRPIKLNPAIPMMLPPILIVELTISGAIVLGRICFLMILKLREPVAFAASIYSLVFIAITVARIILADIYEKSDRLHPLERQVMRAA